MNKKQINFSGIDIIEGRLVDIKVENRNQNGIPGVEDIIIFNKKEEEIDSMTAYGGLLSITVNNTNILSFNDKMFLILNIEALSILDFIGLRDNGPNILKLKYAPTQTSIFLQIRKLFDKELIYMKSTINWPGFALLDITQEIEEEIDSGGYH